MEHISKKTKRGRQLDGSANPIDIYVGNRIKIRRQMLNISQEKLGNLLGITFQQIQKYERGINRIGASRLWDIANVLDINMTYFFENIPTDIMTSSPRFTINKNATLNSKNINDPLFEEIHLNILNNLCKIESNKQKEAIEIITKALSKSYKLKDLEVNNMKEC
ncbi:MAG: helix-turn-helix transcriptional regulator [Alphaproteobacteria bacterium]